jgi:G:T-mismatch repair DNA endonuclease (very short patch repair protein)
MGVMNDRNTKGQFIKGHSELEVLRRKNSATSMGKHFSPETEFQKGEHRSPQTEFKIGNHPKTEFKKGHKESLEAKEKRLRKIFKSNAMIKPNKKEIKLNTILQSLFPNEYSINVKGEVMILGGKVPDFVNINGQKKVIELFGDYWHSDEFIQRTGHSVSEEDRMDYFKQFGWDTLIIWEHELKDKNLLKEKILKFNCNGGA